MKPSISPPEVSGDTVSILIDDDTYLPFLPRGSRVYYNRDEIYTGGFDRCIGAQCIAQVKNGDVCMRTLKSGTKGKYSLLNYNGALIENAEIEWLAIVQFFKPSIPQKSNPKK